MVQSPVIYAASHLSFGFAIFFLYQTLINFILYRQKNANKKLILNHIGLCFFTTAYALLSFLLVWRISISVNAVFLQAMWMSGSLVNYFYISTVKMYLSDESKGLDFIKKLPLLSAFIAFVLLVINLVFGINLFVDSVTPFIETKNVYMQTIGGFNPPLIVKILSVVILFTTVSASVYFLKFIYKSGKAEPFLTAGILLNFLIMANDLSPAIYDAAMAIPLMYLANTFEIIRITHSNQKELSQRVNLMREELIHVSKLSEAGNYYAQLSHEILNPLFAAKGYLGLLKQKLGERDEKDDIYRYTEIIQKQHEKIHSLASNVKSYTKSGSKIMSVVDLNELIGDSIDTVQLKFYNLNIRLDYRPYEEELKVKCYKDQIVQVITNILDNSIDAIAEISEKWIKIEVLEVKNNYALISIMDSGLGIPKHLHSKVWDHRFTTKEHGAGLGLSICREIIRNHGGEISINLESKNTQFILKLPIQ